MPAFSDLTGKQFGRLTVTRRAENKGRRAQWLCECICGKKITVASEVLISGHTRSCGCLKIELVAERGRSSRTHGMKKTRLYNIWFSMRQRCSRPQKDNYKYYGGRGITVCERWNSFENFMHDMGNPPSDQHSIDRIDTNGNYEPSNCRWATMKEQQNNRRDNHILEYQGESMTISRWAEKIGVSQSLLIDRLSRGWTIEKTLSTPLRNRRTK